MKRIIVVSAAALVMSTAASAMAPPVPTNGRTDVTSVTVYQLSPQDAVTAGLDPAAVAETDPTMTQTHIIQKTSTPVRVPITETSEDVMRERPHAVFIGPLNTTGCFKAYETAGGVSSLDGREEERVNPAWCSSTRGIMRSTNTSDHYCDATFLYSCDWDSPPFGSPLVTQRGCSTNCLWVDFTGQTQFSLWILGYVIHDHISTQTHLESSPGATGWFQWWWS